MVCAPRIRHLRQRIIRARHEAYKESNWDKHAYLIQVLGYQELQIRDEALAFILFKLEISYEVFQRTYDYFMAKKDQKSQNELSLMRKMQLKLQDVEEKETREEMKDKLLSREQALQIFEQLLKLEK